MSIAERVLKRAGIGLGLYKTLHDQFKDDRPQKVFEPLWPDVPITEEEISAQRVANRVAAYLNVGDLVLYGKWKNAKAQIKSFGVDRHGNPTILVMPLTGKHQGEIKTIGMFQVWKADPAERHSLGEEPTIVLP